MASTLNKTLIAAAITAASATALADDHTDRLYLGGSFSYNTIDSPFDGGDSIDATGIQGFGGYQLGQYSGGLSTKVELGFSQTDDFDNTNEDITGVWVAMVGEKELPEVDPNLSLIGRVGLDFGDDDGLLTGFGVGYDISDRLEVRGEFVNKDASNQYLASLLVHL